MQKRWSFQLVVLDQLNTHTHIEKENYTQNQFQIDCISKPNKLLKEVTGKPLHIFGVGKDF